MIPPLNVTDLFPVCPVCPVCPRVSHMERNQSAAGPSPNHAVEYIRLCSLAVACHPSPHGLAIVRREAFHSNACPLFPCPLSFIIVNSLQGSMVTSSVQPFPLLSAKRRSRVALARGTVWTMDPRWGSCLGLMTRAYSRWCAAYLARREREKQTKQTKKSYWKKCPTKRDSQPNSGT